MMEELSFFLGLQIKQSSKRTSICYEKYIKELLKKFQMKDAKPIDTPMGEPGPLVNVTIYKGIIGSLLYLIVSQPDIVFNVGIYARLQPKPKKSQSKEAKRILRYLKGI